MNGAIYIEKGMLFNSKKQLQRAVKLLHLKIAREYFVIKSTKKSWQLVCRSVEQGCRFKLTSFNDKHTNMWKVGRYIKEHTCDMGTCRDGHFNLDVKMIANVLRVDIEKTPRRKAYLGRKRAFEKVYGTWEGSFAEFPRFIEALKHFNPGTIVEWKTERRVDVIEDVFNYVFWTFKPCIDGFVFCRPVISIDETHVYGKYDIKLLIVIATDARGLPVTAMSESKGLRVKRRKRRPSKVPFKIVVDIVGGEKSDFRGKGLGRRACQRAPKGALNFPPWGGAPSRVPAGPF
ncbi:hypothetical protein KY290_011483 [Solanum tuberosum]|uniref:Transposase MuDR plant domain-containing protein n=1 Tax=Solanum tuberosum TaxID=4113 RepID=A0ABQ7W208_SOLTU|nr:hypothetical protein KY284_011587 [Solanum tuberosum]KAH0774346.1 hypothetical protein KY290_011483 [Solanum tuberosum]